MDERRTVDFEEPSIRVTLKDVYTDVLIMKAMLQTLQSELPGHIEQTHKELADVRIDLQDHERRLRVIETKMWTAVGVFGLIAAISPYVTTLLIHP